MPFLEQEQSIEDGRPIQFYAFTLGSVTWRYTSADENLNAGGYDWIAAAISDDGVKQTGETIVDAMTIVAPSWIGPAQVFMGGAPSRSVLITIYSKHEGDAEMAAVYVGEITQINHAPVPGACRITCETLTSSMQREGLRLGWQRTCPYALYDPVTCKVNKALWATPFVVLAIDGFTVTIELATARADGYYNNGFAEWTHPIRGVEYMPIDTHAAGSPTTLTLLGHPGDLFVGAQGVAYPGCNFTPASCQGFSNYDNYGGVPDLPGKSPFDGSPVF